MAELGAERCNDLSKDTQTFRTCLVQLRRDPGPLAQAGGTLASQATSLFPSAWEHPPLPLVLGTFQARGAYGGALSCLAGRRRSCCVCSPRCGPEGPSQEVGLSAWF